jgi:hypothetical protein
MDWAPSGTPFFSEDWSQLGKHQHADTDDDGNAEPGLYYEAQTEEFETQEDHLGSASSGNGNDNTMAPGSLLGAWSGEWSGMNANKRNPSSASDGLLTVNITTHTPQGISRARVWMRSESSLSRVKSKTGE